MNDNVSALFAKQIEEERDELAGYLSELVTLCFAAKPPSNEWSKAFIAIEQASLPLRVGHYLRKKKREEVAK